MLENDRNTPTIGDKVQLVIRPSVKFDQTSVQAGTLIAVRHDETGLTVGRVQITQPGDWSGCVVAAVFNLYSDDWRATVPVCDRAKQLWGRAGEAATEAA